ncbi:uncharacterized protein LOC123698724 [Colias croceus]|uniref:uncharacterized protein LOC123698724 n=1 Tax=Colias crocea TaxID=72248 RepID=UPI001E27F1B5|nr:uncharacterized protein LOC123698724 [Colias croceus]
MKILILHCCVVVLTLICIQEEVSCQVMYPSYGGMPNGDDGDDDLGLLLTVLLFAAKQRSNSLDRYGYGGCGCCNNCCRSTQKTIPIPYPIPITTNNPIIYKSQSSENDSDTDDCNDDTAQGSQKSSHHESSEEEETTSTTRVKYKPMLVSESAEISMD